jgi:hypothetical protein
MARAAAAHETVYPMGLAAAAFMIVVDFPLLGRASYHDHGLRGYGVAEKALR